MESERNVWKYVKQHIKKTFGSTAFNNVLVIISLIFSIFAGTQAITSTQQVHKIQNTIEDLNITNYSQNAQNAQTINNNGSSYDDIKSISNDEFSSKMDRLYETFDIIEKVADNPNLHFSLIWYGTQEELDNSDKSKLPDHVTYYISDK